MIDEPEPWTEQSFQQMLLSSDIVTRNDTATEDVETPQQLLTADHLKYDRIENEIQEKFTIASVLPESDRPVEILEEEFSGLMPRDGHLDDDDIDDDEVYRHFNKKTADQEEEDEMDREIMANTDSAFLAETLTQKDGETEYNYSTTSATHGLALLLISSTLSNEKDKDVAKIRRLLTDKLSFRIDEITIKDKESIIKVLQQVGRREDTEGDCLMMVILSKGLRDDAGREFVYCGPDKVETYTLWPLIDTSASTISEKPKIFLQIAWPVEPDNQVEADSGKAVMLKDLERPTAAVYLTPSMAHFFIVSAVPSTDSLEDEDMVNEFVNTFTQVMELNVFNKDWDIARIMTEVNYQLSMEYSRSPNFTSSLTRSFRFEPKTPSN